LNEKELQQLFVQKLKLARWHVLERIYDNTQHSQGDVIAYHPSFDEYILFEIKVPQGWDEETKALRQLIRYHNANFPRIRIPALYCYMKPKLFGYDQDQLCKRFFWRWGFGYGSTETLRVEFVNGENRNTINLAYPQEGYIEPKTKIRLIKETSDKYWMNNYDTDQLLRV
jgi:hypothetical protein